MVRAEVHQFSSTESNAKSHLGLWAYLTRRETSIMAVPSQQQLHRPILEIVDGARGDVVPLQELKDALIRQFSLSDLDLAEKVPSGQNRFVNRVYWAVSYLRRAGMLESPSRARFRITPQGCETLRIRAGDIEIRLLKDLIESRRHQRSSESTVVSGTIDTIGMTPDEQVAAFHGELHDQLADELLNSVRRVAPDRFEQLMVRLLEKMGYGEGQKVGRVGDEGIDGVMNQDLLGLEKVYIQAKRWEGRIGEPEIRNFSGSLQAKGAGKGVFITTSVFGSKAREMAERISVGNQIIRLIDGEELARLMISHDVGVVTEMTYHVKKLDENYLAGEV